MYPDKVTICNRIEMQDGVKYYTFLVKNVFAYSSNGIVTEGKGEQPSSTSHCILSNEALKDYVDYSEYKGLADKSNNYTLHENDYIIIGELLDVVSEEDIRNSNLEYFLIKNITKSLYGDEDNQNIEVTN